MTEKKREILSGNNQKASTKLTKHCTKNSFLITTQLQFSNPSTNDSIATFLKDQDRCDTYFPMLFNEECKQQIANSFSS